MRLRLCGGAAGAPPLPPPRARLAAARHAAAALHALRPAPELQPVERAGGQGKPGWAAEGVPTSAPGLIESLRGSLRWRRRHGPALPYGRSLRSSKAFHHFCPAGGGRGEPVDRPRRGLPRAAPRLGGGAAAGAGLGGAPLAAGLPAAAAAAAAQRGKLCAPGQPGGGRGRG